jgi:hypothetical protein
MLDERLEIAIAVEQRIFAFNAACGDHGINRFANAHANRAQLAVIPGSRLALPTGFPDRPIGGISLRGIPSHEFSAHLHGRGIEAVPFKPPPPNPPTFLHASPAPSHPSSPSLGPPPCTC